MNPEQHPALITDHEALPTLTLILPSDMGQDQILNRLVQAIRRVRTDLAARVCRFQHRSEQCATTGDKLGQALCRGQVIGGEHAAVAIDEEIIGLFDLWEQYDDGIPQARQDTGDEEAAQDAYPLTRDVGSARAVQGSRPAGTPSLIDRPGYPLNRRSLGLGRVEAGVMAVAWRAADGWLPARAVHDRLDYPRPLAYSTTSSAMTTLHRKGLLARRRGPAGRWEYRAARSPDEHLGELIGDLLDACPSPQTALSHALRRPVRLSAGHH